MKKTLLGISLWAALTGNLAAQEAISGKLQDGSTMELYGVGLFQDLGADIYLGAVYVRPKAPEIKTGHSRKMEMRLVDNLSGRKFTRLWQDAITLNSSHEERSKNTDAIQKFGEIYKDNLVKGDHISFDFIETQNKTVFLLNDIVMGEIAGENLYNILLNCWIGTAPVSTQFKSGILKTLDTTTSTKYQELYQDLVFSSDRKNQVNESSSLYKAQKAKEAEEARLKEELLAKEKAEAEHLAKEAEAEKARQEAARIAQEAKATEEARQKAEQVAKEKAEAERIAKKEAEEKAKFEAEQAKLSAEYRTKLVKWVTQHSVYPQKAAEKRLEGKVELQITSDRNGKILGVLVAKSSKNSTFDEAIKEMLIAEAGPLPKMPTDIKKDTFEFIMPMSFTLDQ